MSTRSPAERSLDAEVRGVESGHRAFVQDDGSVLVKSDTYEGKRYRVTFAADRVHDPIVFTCRPEGEAVYKDDHLDVTGKPGYLPCLHSALAARRLQREGLALLTLGAGRYVLTQKAADLTEPRRLPPFEPIPADDADAAAGRALLRDAF